MRALLDAESLDVVLERRRVVEPPGFDETAGHRHQVDDHRQPGPGQRHAVADPAQRRRQRHRQAAVALAAQGGEHLAPDQPPLQGEGAEREDEQDQRQRRRLALVELRTDDGEEDFGRQHAEVTAQDNGIAEVGDRLDEGHQPGVGEARQHQGPADGAKGLPAVGAQRLRRLLERGADALHDADQDQEGDRRKREDLRQQHPLQAVDPARLRNAEGVFEKLVDHPGAAEEQDQAEADDERRGDDRQHGEHAQEFLGGKIGARHDQGEGQPQQRASARGQRRQQEGVPGHAAAPAAGQTGEAPDAGREEARGDGAKPVTVRPVEGAEQDLADREEGEGQHQRAAQAQRPGDETVALEQAARGDAVGEQEEEGGEHRHRAQADAVLHRPVGSGERFEPFKLPAANADRQTLCRQPQQPSQTADEQQPGELPTLAQEQQPEADADEQDAGHAQPRLAVLPRLEQGRGRGRVTDEPLQPCPGEQPVLQGVPGQQGVSEEAEGDPAEARFDDGVAHDERTFGRNEGLGNDRRTRRTRGENEEEASKRKASRFLRGLRIRGAGCSFRSEADRRTLSAAAR